MIRLKIFLVLLLMNQIVLLAQDEITFRSGDILKAKILEIGAEEIMYKKSDNLSGPTYNVKKNLVFMIKYENGTKDVFGTDTPGIGKQTAGILISETPAIIFFFRPGKIIGSSPEIIVGTYVPDEVIVALRNGHWFRSEYKYQGLREFVTGIYSMNEGKLSVDIIAGKTYYVRCSIMKGMGLQSQLELVDEETGKREMSGLKEQVKAK
jgi:hypothetical protein